MAAQLIAEKWLLGKKGLLHLWLWGWSCWNQHRGSPGGPSTGVAGDRQGRASHLGPEASFAVLGLAEERPGPVQGSGLIGEGAGGLETHRGASKMSREVHGKGWQLPARWSAAAIGCPPSCIFIRIHERAAPNGAAVSPAVPRTRCCAHACPRPRPGCILPQAPGTVLPTSSAWHRRGLRSVPCQELLSEGGLAVPPSCPRCPTSPSAPLLAAGQSLAEIVFSGVDQLCKAVGKTDSEADLAMAGDTALLREQSIRVPQGCRQTPPGGTALGFAAEAGGNGPGGDGPLCHTGLAQAAGERHVGGSR